MGFITSKMSITSMASEDLDLQHPDLLVGDCAYAGDRSGVRFLLAGFCFSFSLVL